MNPQQIEDAFWRCDSSQLRDVLLSGHACLLARAAVPRCYVSDSDEPCRTWLAAHSCVKEDVRRTKTITSDALTALGLSEKMFRTLGAEEAEEVKGVIERLLQEMYGPGIVHYEMARFTPFTEEDASRFLLAATGGDLYLDTMLSKRAKDKARYLSAYGSALHKATPLWHTSAFVDVLRHKVESQWQQSWLSHEAYAVRDIIHSLSFDLGIA